MTTKSQPLITKKTIGKVRYFLSVNFLESPSLAGAHYAKSESIPLIDEIYGDWESKDGTKWSGARIIRYKPGEKTIYFDEQSEASKDDNKNKRPEFLWMYNGILSVKPEEKLLIEYLERCNFNASNPKRNIERTAIFKAVSHEQTAENEVGKSRSLYEAQKLIFEDMSFSNKIAYATVLNINTSDRETIEIEHDLLVMAKKNPEQFIDGFKNPMVKQKYYVLMAIKNNIISINLTTNSIMYADGNLLMQGSPGENLIESFISQTSTGQGQAVMSVLLDRLARIDPLIASFVQSEKRTPVINAPVLGNEKRAEEKLPPVAQSGFKIEIPKQQKNINHEIQEAIDLGVIEQKGMWFNFRGEKVNSYAKMQAAWDKNELFKKEIRNAVQIAKDARKKMNEVIVNAPDGDPIPDFPVADGDPIPDLPVADDADPFL